MTQHTSLRGNGYAISRDLHPRLIDVDRLRPLGRDTRKHPPGQIRKLKASIEQFGFVVPTVIVAGALTIRASLPPALRDAFLSGQWNPTAMLLDRFEDVRAVAARLPYIRGF